MLRRAAPALLTLALLAGCGGDGDGGGTSTSTSTSTEQPSTSEPAGGESPTRAELIARGDRVCKEANDRIRTLNRRIARAAAGAASPVETLTRIAPHVQRGAGLQREYVGRFSELEPPTEDRETFATMVRAAEEQAALLGRLADAASRGDIERFGTLRQELDRATKRSRELLQGYGFERCGRGGAAGQ